jgi:predicted DNA-binding protein
LGHGDFGVRSSEFGVQSSILSEDNITDAEDKYLATEFYVDLPNGESQIPGFSKKPEIF